LRKVLEDGNENGKYIETVARRGYRWIGPSMEQRSAASIESVAVLPLESLYSDPEQKYFTISMTEALLISLGRIEALRVIGYSGTAATDFGMLPNDIAKRLGAAAFLTISAIREGDRVRLMVRLVRVDSGEQVWADHYDGNLGDVLEFQSRVGRHVAQAVQIRLTHNDRRRLAELRTVVPDAYNEYLKGRYHWNRRAPDNFRKAMDHFKRALEIDPAWSQPYSGLADAYSLLGSTRYDVMPPREAMPKAKAAALKAIELDSHSAEAHTSLAYVLFGFDWDWAAAEQHFVQALELNPGYATANHWYGHFLLARGRLEEGVSRMRAALDRDPLSLAINMGLGWSLYLARDYDGAIRQYSKTLEMEGKFPLVRCLRGMALDRLERYSESLAEVEAALALAPDGSLPLSCLARTNAAAGNPIAARKYLDRLVWLAQSKYVPAVYIGAAFCALGDGDQAFGWMAKACEERAHQLVYLNVEPSLESLRTDSRFVELSCRIGLA
jgi:TolB-like protein/Tfp pilus assembly protein PilF